jgi:replication factor C small subunit
MARDTRLWVEIHRPRDLSEYVWVNDAQRSQVEGWVRDKTIPSMILSGSPGTGKTSLAKCLFAELGVESSDIRYVNASHTNGVDDMRALGRFAETMPMGEFRYVLLDEGDMLSIPAQTVLRNMMEEYSNICRWIITCNYPHKIIPASRPRAVRRAHRHDLDRRGR